MPVLEVEALTRRFGDFTAVDGLTLGVEAGEVFGLLGANGAGKTVTLAILHRGRVMVIGAPDELKASMGAGRATMDEVFAHYAQGALEPGGASRETARTRRTARRLG